MARREGVAARDRATAGGGVAAAVAQARASGTCKRARVMRPHQTLFLDARCDVDDCDLRAMSRRRCSLAGCGAAAAEGGGGLRRCSGCRRAAYCCAAHQHAAWPRHKLLCAARAAVEAACAALQS